MVKQENAQGCYVIVFQKKEYFTPGVADEFVNHLQGRKAINRTDCKLIARYSYHLTTDKTRRRDQNLNT